MPSAARSWLAGWAILISRAGIAVMPKDPPAAAQPRTLRRALITPGGGDLRLELGGAGERAAAFMIDAAIMLGVQIVATLLTVLAVHVLKNEMRDGMLAVIWLLGFFILR